MKTTDYLALNLVEGSDDPGDIENAYNANPKKIDDKIKAMDTDIESNKSGLNSALLNIASLQLATTPKYTVAIGVANQTIPASTDTQMTLIQQGNSYPLDGSWATSNWTCPTSGVYEINANIMFNVPAGALVQSKLFVNGALDQFLSSIYCSTAQFLGGASTSIKKLNAGDVLKFYVYCNTSGGTIGGNYSRINIKKLS